ncbi:hypothetical protein PHYPSEUDO_009633 [Phytophthora pseudosyringae]|uniref:Uncharacterized protein n=1 Tax=Phytophthora pseudosyringae TaxID=221518 RepID=A0A8T1WNX8_9STRA|nr:hypothetical protein PHYPSEUDO_009633 [Phytophthora pseudosyringae]
MAITDDPESRLPPWPDSVPSSDLDNQGAVLRRYLEGLMNATVASQPASRMGGEATTTGPRLVFSPSGTIPVYVEPGRCALAQSYYRSLAKRWTPGQHGQLLTWRRDTAILSTEGDQ